MLRGGRIKMSERWIDSLLMIAFRSLGYVGVGVSVGLQHKSNDSSMMIGVVKHPILIYSINTDRVLYVPSS